LSSFAVPLQFPYDLDEPGVEPTGPRKASDIERQLRQFEIDPKKPVLDAALSSSSADSTTATAFTCDKREASTFPQAKLLSISQRLLDEWLPNLDVGEEKGTEEQQKVRQQFIDVVAGKTVLARRGESEKENAEGEGNGVKGFAPWSSAYAGHQFGNFAGQLGDGRAISIREYCIYRINVLAKRLIFSHSLTLLSQSQLLRLKKSPPQLDSVLSRSNSKVPDEPHTLDSLTVSPSCEVQ
jgi:hypothetical protein